MTISIDSKIFAECVHQSTMEDCRDFWSGLSKEKKDSFVSKEFEKQFNALSDFHKNRDWPELSKSDSINHALGMNNG